MTSASHRSAHHAHGSTAFHTMTIRSVPGIIGGLIGGVLFGVLMQIIDMMPMVAQIVGSEALGVGWTVHLVISAGIGLLYAWVLGPLVHGFASGLITGIVWGLVWWIVGGLILMPTFIGMSNMVLVFNTTAWQSLAGHAIYGIFLGATFGLMAPRMLERSEHHH